MRILRSVDYSLGMTTKIQTMQVARLFQTNNLTEHLTAAANKMWKRVCNCGNKAKLSKLSIKLHLVFNCYHSAQCENFLHSYALLHSYKSIKNSRTFGYIRIVIRSMLHEYPRIRTYSRETYSRVSIEPSQDRISDFSPLSHPVTCSPRQSDSLFAASNPSF